MGKVLVIGIGPGTPEYLCRRAAEALGEAEVVFGYTSYIRQLQRFFPEKHYVATPMREEKARCRMALKEAQAGRTAALVSSGDAGIYGMAGLLYEELLAGRRDGKYGRVEVEVIPGVTAAGMAAAVLGAPLMHDFCVISLSDLLTPWELIERRLALAAEGDFVICLYNPGSKGRPGHLRRAAEVLLRTRAADTPVGIVRHAGRAGQEAQLTTLAGLPPVWTDMHAVVVVGNSATFVEDGRMVTPRGYRR